MRLFSYRISFNTHSRITLRRHHKLFPIIFLLICTSQLRRFYLKKGMVAQEEVNLSFPTRDRKMHFLILLSLKREGSIKMAPAHSGKTP